MPPPHTHKTSTNAPTPTPTPTNHLCFDAWSTSSTGHQVADSAQSKAYRILRQEKLARQFGEGGGDCTYTYAREGKGGGLERGTWVEEFDDRRGGGGGGGEDGGARGNVRQRDIRGMFGVSKAVSSKGEELLLLKENGKNEDGEKKEEQEDEAYTLSSSSSSSSDNTNIKDTYTTPSEPTIPPSNPKTEYPQIFTTLTIYINAPSHHLLSDHKLKHLLTLHGATVALSLSRRVTHVIVGKPNTRLGSGASGAGGGLASGKLQREMARAGWKGWKVVFVEWVLESIKAGKRLSEARFAMQLAQKGQRSVLAFGR